MAINSQANGSLAATRSPQARHAACFVPQRASAESLRHGIGGGGPRDPASGCVRGGPRPASKPDLLSAKPFCFLTKFEIVCDRHLRGTLPETYVVILVV